TRTGPEMAEEVLTHYRVYLAYSLVRLFVFAFLIIAFLAYAGIVVYVACLVVLNGTYRPALAVVVAAGVGLLLVSRRFAPTLLYSPAVIAASSLSSMTHFYPLWRALAPYRLQMLDTALLATGGFWLAAGLTFLASSGAWIGFASLAGVTAFYLLTVKWATRCPEPPPLPARKPSQARPNILLTGSDPLRADRLFGAGYRRELMPNLARLARRGTHFTDCYVPCARTAPSLASMLTGTWPHRHGVRDTFVTPEQTRLPVPS